MAGTGRPFCQDLSSVTATAGTFPNDQLVSRPLNCYYDSPNPLHPTTIVSLHFCASITNARQQDIEPY